MRTGVTVMPEYFQNEGVENVVARLAAAKVDMIATSPYVMEPADEKTGSREPPVDAGAGSVLPDARYAARAWGCGINRRRRRS